MIRTTFAIVTLAAATQGAAQITVLSWNVESGGNDPAVIARQLVELGRADIYCLQEVGTRNIGRYGAAVRETHGKGYRYAPSVTGRGAFSKCKNRGMLTRLKLASATFFKIEYL